MPPEYSPETTRTLKLWVVLARCSNAMHERARRSISCLGISESEFAVAEVLYHLGPLPLSTVGEKVLLSGGSMTYIIDKLEKRGLACRQPCGEDRRVIKAALTEAGHQLMAQRFPEHADELVDAMSVLSEQEQLTLTGLLRRLGHSVADGNRCQSDKD